MIKDLVIHGWQSNCELVSFNPVNPRTGSTICMKAVLEKMNVLKKVQDYYIWLFGRTRDANGQLPPLPPGFLDTFEKAVHIFELNHQRLNLETED